jgi:F-type H+-transporting ATPase subunit delta
VISEVAKRYARALFECATEVKKGDEIFAQLKGIALAVNKDDDTKHFISSPIIPGNVKAEALSKAVGGQAAEELKSLIHLLIEKNRIELFKEIAEAYGQIADEAQGVTRGEVRSASTLNEDDRRKLEQTIAGVTKKKVILNFTEDKKLMGGLVAQVGGWSFDDSLQSHLTRLTEDLNRRTH